MAKSNEPLWWSLFAAGGMLAAMVMPALIFLTGIAVPFVNAERLPDERLLAYARVAEVVGPWWVRGLLFVIISLPLFHWAHRFRYTLIDFGVHGGRTLVAVLCYGSALLGTFLAGFVTLTL